MHDFFNTLGPSFSKDVPPPASNALLRRLELPARPERFGVQPVTLAAGQSLCEAGQPPESVVFPAGSVLSLIGTVGPAHSLQVGVIGREGMSAVPEVWAECPGGTRTIVEVPGPAYVMSVAAFRRCIDQSPAFRHAALAYTGEVFRMLATSAVCYRHHSVRQQCARWLLQMQDRLGTDDVPVTHEHLAELLGVFRPTITVALGELQQEGLVEVARGRVIILDRNALAPFACGCYTVAADVEPGLAPARFGVDLRTNGHATPATVNGRWSQASSWNSGRTMPFHTT